MNPRSLIILDAVLFLAICALIYLVLVATVETPPPAPAFANAEQTVLAPVERESPQRAGHFQNLDQREIFTTLIPIPPPPPPPPPPVPEVPNLTEIASRFTIYMILPTSAEILDSATNAREVHELNQEFQVRSNVAGAGDVTVKITDLDDYQMSLTLEMEWNGETQTETINMFDF